MLRDRHAYRHAIRRSCGREAADRRHGADRVRRGTPDPLDRPAQLRRPLHCRQSLRAADHHPLRCAGRRRSGARPRGVAEARHVPGRGADPRGATVERSIDCAGRIDRHAHLFPRRTRQPRYPARRGCAVGELRRLRQPDDVPERARVRRALFRRSIADLGILRFARRERSDLGACAAAPCRASRLRR